MEHRRRARGYTASPTWGGEAEDLTAHSDTLGRVVKSAELAARTLPGPLDYRVVHPVPVSVRGQPAPQAPELGRISHGRVVLGFPGKGWLRLCQGGAPLIERRLEGCWVFIGNRLEALCMKVNLQQSCAESVTLGWKGLSTKRVGYSIEWQPALPTDGVVYPNSGPGGSGSMSSITGGSSTPSLPALGRGGHMVTREPVAFIGGLSPSISLRVRAAARLFAAASSGTDDVRVLGPWCSVETESACSDLDVPLEPRIAPQMTGRDHKAQGVGAATPNAVRVPLEPTSKRETSTRDTSSASTCKTTPPHLAARRTALEESGDRRTLSLEAAFKQAAAFDEHVNSGGEEGGRCRVEEQAFVAASCGEHGKTQVQGRSEVALDEASVGAPVFSPPGTPRNEGCLFDFHELEPLMMKLESSETGAGRESILTPPAAAQSPEGVGGISDALEDAGPCPCGEVDTLDAVRNAPSSDAGGVEVAVALGTGVRQPETHSGIGPQDAQASPQGQGTAEEVLGTSALVQLAEPCRIVGPGDAEAPNGSLRARPEEEEEGEAIFIAKSIARLAARSLAKPLEYEIVRKGTVCVRSEPHAKAKELGQLPSGFRVFGFPGKGWLWLRDSGMKRLPPELVGQWVFIGCRLQATCLRMSVEARFPEALDIEWEGVPARQAVYSVEWRPVRSVERVVGLNSADTDGSTGRHTVTGSRRALLCGIPAGATVQARVAARIMGPPGSDEDVRVLGTWSEFDTGPWVPEEIEMDPESWVDPRGNRRGGCAESLCPQFVWNGVGRWSYNSALVRCLRCGQAFHKHEKMENVESDNDSRDALAPYVVSHSQVIVRGQRHLQSTALGTLKLGARVLGVPQGRWLRVELAPIRSLLLPKGPSESVHARGWVMLDGSQVGLGRLMAPCAAAHALVRESTNDLWDPWGPVDRPVEPCATAPRAFPPVARGGRSPSSYFLCVPLAVGFAVPKGRITNADLQGVVDTTAEWIRARTGIVSRHVLRGICEEGGDDDDDDDGADENDGADLTRLAVRAATAALELSGCKAHDLDLVLLCTSSPEDLFGDAAMVASEIGAQNAVAFDLTAACSGFLFGVVTASQFLHTGTHRRALVIGADALSRWVDWGERNSSILFGDGAGAMVLAAVEGAQNSGLLGFAMHSDGWGHDYLKLPFCGSPHELRTSKTRRRRPLSVQKGGYGSITMNGPEVYNFAVQRVPEVIVEALNSAGLAVAQADWLVLHQANIRIVEEVARQLWIPPSKLITNLHSYGNTSAASIPLALAEATLRGDVKFGDVIVCAGFGAGLSWGAAVLRWGSPHMIGLAPVRERVLATPSAALTASRAQLSSAQKGRAGGGVRGVSAPPPQ